jgi:hypothetical protein
MGKTSLYAAFVFIVATFSLVSIHASSYDRQFWVST